MIRRKTKTLDVLQSLKEYMKPGMCYRIEPLCRHMNMKKPALRRYLRRLVNAGLLNVHKHPLYPKRKFYSLVIKSQSPQVTEDKKVLKEVACNG